MTWRLQYAEELKKEIEYHRNRTGEYFTLLVQHKNPEVSKQIDVLCNPFNPEKTPTPSYAYKVGDVLMNRWNFKVARIIEVSGEWYVFDRRGMDTSNTVTTQVHRNSVEPEYTMRKVEVDLPNITFTIESELKDA